MGMGMGMMGESGINLGGLGQARVIMVMMLF